VKGDTTAATCGTSSIWVKSCSSAAVACGLLWMPPSILNTTSPEAPDRAGKRSLSRSWATWESRSPRLNFSEKPEPAAEPATATPTNTNSQIASTIQRRR
jgi:hypothetical protein